MKGDRLDEKWQNIRKPETRRQPKNCVASQNVAIQRERNEALKKALKIMLFTNAPSGCDNNEAVEHFEIMKRRALKELIREEMPQSDQNATDTNETGERIEGVG